MALLAGCLFGSGAFTQGIGEVRWAPVPDEEGAATEPVSALPAASLQSVRSWVDVDEAVQPAVVNVSAQRGPDTVEEFFRRFVEGLPPTPTPRPSLGSEFIVASTGEIVTNAHVIDGAVDIVARLIDGSEHRASRCWPWATLSGSSRP